MARESRPNVIILDIHLPKLDGWQVLSELKSDPVLVNVPVIILSVEEQRARAFSFGACEYLVKPVEPDRLVNIVRRAVLPGAGDILVVDDDDDTREMVSRNLRRAGFTTVEARDGEEALLRARVVKPSMVILDLLMPRVDGFEVLRALRAEGQEVPVLVLTGKTLTPDDQAILKEGLVRVVTKDGVAIEHVIREARKALVARRVLEAAKLPRILYVEDSPQNRDIVRRYLGRRLRPLRGGGRRARARERGPRRPRPHPDGPVAARGSTAGRRRAASRPTRPSSTSRSSP